MVNQNNKQYTASLVEGHQKNCYAIPTSCIVGTNAAIPLLYGFKFSMSPIDCAVPVSHMLYLIREMWKSISFMDISEEDRTRSSNLIGTLNVISCLNAEEKELDIKLHWTSQSVVMNFFSNQALNEVLARIYDEKDSKKRFKVGDA